MSITNINQLVHGMKVRCAVPGRIIEDGLIHINKYKEVYLLEPFGSIYKTCRILGNIHNGFYDTFYWLEQQPEKKEEFDNLNHITEEEKEIINHLNNNEMKTVLVIYTESKQEMKSSSVFKAKKYAFNAPDDLKEGDMLDSPDYSTPMQVVKVLDRAFKYFNYTTGELSDEFKSTHQWEIKTLKLFNKESDVVYASKINEEE